MEDLHDSTGSILFQGMFSNSGSHLVCHRKGAICQENRETVTLQLYSLGSICRRNWWRFSPSEKEEKKPKNRNAAGRIEDAKTKGRYQSCRVKTTPVSSQWCFCLNTPAGSAREVTSFTSRWAGKDGCEAKSSFSQGYQNIDITKIYIYFIFVLFIDCHSAFSWISAIFFSLFFFLLLGFVSYQVWRLDWLNEIEGNSSWLFPCSDYFFFKYILAQCSLSLWSCFPLVQNILVISMLEINHEWSWYFYGKLFSSKNLVSQLASPLLRNMVQKCNCSPCKFCRKCYLGSSYGKLRVSEHPALILLLKEE